MSKVLCEREDLVAIADAVRNKTGETEAMTLGRMVNGINGIVVPTGTMSITLNGTYDVANYAIVDVNVAGNGDSGSSSDVQTCTFRISYSQHQGGTNSDNEGTTCFATYTTLIDGVLDVNYQKIIPGYTEIQSIVKGTPVTLIRGNGISQYDIIDANYEGFYQAGAFALMCKMEQDDNFIALDIYF